jgi:hypothetical protein
VRWPTCPVRPRHGRRFLAFSTPTPILGVEALSLSRSLPLSLRGSGLILGAEVSLSFSASGALSLPRSLLLSLRPSACESGSALSVGVSLPHLLSLSLPVPRVSLSLSVLAVKVSLSLSRRGCSQSHSHSRRWSHSWSHSHRTTLCHRGTKGSKKPRRRGWRRGFSALPARCGYEACRMS